MPRPLIQLCNLNHGIYSSQVACKEGNIFSVCFVEINHGPCLLLSLTSIVGSVQVEEMANKRIPHSNNIFVLFLIIFIVTVSIRWFNLSTYCWPALIYEQDLDLFNVWYSCSTFSYTILTQWWCFVYRFLLAMAEVIHLRPRPRCSDSGAACCRMRGSHPSCWRRPRLSTQLPLPSLLAT